MQVTPGCTPQWYPNPVMGLSSIFRKVFLVDLIQGLGVTFRYQDPREIYTEQYPLERPQVAERYRGAPRLNVNPDTDEFPGIFCGPCPLALSETFIRGPRGAKQKPPPQRACQLYLR